MCWILFCGTGRLGDTGLLWTLLWWSGTDRATLLLLDFGSWVPLVGLVAGWNAISVFQRWTWKWPAWAWTRVWDVTYLPKILVRPFHIHTCRAIRMEAADTSTKTESKWIGGSWKPDYRINSRVIDMTDLCVTAAFLTSTYPLSCSSMDTVSRVNDVYTVHLAGIMSVWLNLVAVLWSNQLSGERKRACRAFLSSIGPERPHKGPRHSRELIWEALDSDGEMTDCRVSVWTGC